MRGDLSEKTAGSPKATPAQTLTKLGTWSALHSLQTAQRAAECPFQGPQLVYTSSRQLDLSDSDSDSDS